jgi:hypothetical protein
MEQRLTVFECWDDGEADVVISYLATHGIEAYANSEVPHSVLPVTVDGLGKVQVVVDAASADQARRLIESRLTELSGLEEEPE